jgi:hypothetical protein
VQSPHLLHTQPTVITLLRAGMDVQADSYELTKMTVRKEKEEETRKAIAETWQASLLLPGQPGTCCAVGNTPMQSHTCCSRP